MINSHLRRNRTTRFTVKIGFYEPLKHNSKNRMLVYCSLPAYLVNEGRGLYAPTHKAYLIIKSILGQGYRIRLIFKN